MLEENFGTCVSFFFAGDAFSSFGWPGVAVVSFAVGLILIAVTRLLVTGFDQNVWAVMLLGAYQNQIAEANFGGVLQTIIYQTAYTVCTMLAIRLTAQFLIFARRRLSRSTCHGVVPTAESASPEASASPAPRPSTGGLINAPKGSPA